MEVVYERCAGLDVHKKNVVVCLRVGPRPIAPLRSEVRTFGTMTHDLEALREWLLAEEVTHVAMESTGVYWRPVWNVLEAHFELLLCNARQVKQVPGRKTDVKDCEWLARLLQHGLLPGSFVPPRKQRELRDLTRYQVKLGSQRTAEINRIQKILEDANIKLGDVASDVMGVSGREMIRALIQGETDPVQLADLARRRLRGKIPVLRRALRGCMTEHHRFVLGMHFEAVLAIESALARLDQRIAEVTGRTPPPPAPPPPEDDAPLFSSAAVVSEPSPSSLPTSPRDESPDANLRPAPDAAAAGDPATPASGGQLSFARAVELVDTIPGFSTRLAEQVVAEIGTDMSRFRSAGALASWAGMCPGNNQSAGKKRGTGTTKGDRWLRRGLGIAAAAASRQGSTRLAVRYRRIASRRGANRANVAVAHTLLKVIYFVLSTRQPYVDLGPDFYDRQSTTRQLRYHQRRIEELSAAMAPPNSVTHAA